MAYHYSAYGLNITSESQIAGLSQRPNGDVDVRVNLDTQLHVRWDEPSDPVDFYRSPYCDDHGRPLLVVDKLNPFFRLTFSDQVQFIVAEDGSHVWGTWPATSSRRDTEIYLTGSVLGFVLRLKGKVTVHASSVLYQGQAILLVGDSGFGKSTTAAAFVAENGQPLADDVVVIETDKHGGYTRMGANQIRLWPDSVSGLYGDEDALPKLTHDWPKRFQQIDADPQASYPIAAVFVLQSRSAQGPTIAPMTSAEMCGHLLSNSHADGLQTKASRARSFEVLSQLAERVPGYWLTNHTSFERLKDTCKMCLETIQEGP